MSCVHCNASEQPAGRSRSRFCVSCGRRLLPSALPSRRVRPLQRTSGEPAAAAAG
jgi:hypothetical protein